MFAQPRSLAVLLFVVAMMAGCSSATDGRDIPGHALKLHARKRAITP
jgi:hypothetical protein